MRALKVPLFAVCLALAACGDSELYTSLSEQQANEMIAVLQNNGIDASKSALKDGKWSVVAPSDKFARAVAILHEDGLPREEFATLGELFKKEGFVSSPLEERARLNYGLSQELEHTIGGIDGVVGARVHLALPAPDPLNEVQKPSSASVFVKYQPGTDVSRATGQIKALVVNAIEGLNYDRVSVVYFPAEPLPIARETGPTLQVADLGGAIAIGVLGFGAYRLLGRKREGKRTLVLKD